MNYKRSDRVSMLIKQEVSNMLITELKDPGLGFVTVTGVKLSDDLKHCKVYYSALGGQEQKQKVQQALTRAKGRIRKEIGRRIKLRLVPEITFSYDESTEHADHIEKLIKKIHKNDKKGPSDE
ncbi:MAG: 30S ribosome-binding factor RbfA [candidate division KSB1 bacterium]|nr:30S ribosome-binding factor RbfA [candidate division KSB1 bacterium]